jgi:hypothetical protein
VIDRATAEAAARRYFEHDIDAVTKLVQDWCKKVHAQPFSKAAARQIAVIIREALVGYGGWWDEFASQRERDPYRLLARRIAAALRELRDGLPAYIEAWRLDDTRAPVSLQSTTALYELVLQHALLIEGRKPRARGRARSMERDFSTFVAQKAMELWEGKTEMGTADAFANEALAWIKGRPAVSDDAIRKARTRRT